MSEEYTVTLAEREVVVLRVANGTDVHKLATSIKRNSEENKSVIISCVGVQTINQAMKAVAIANGKVAPNGFLFLLLPYFHVEHQDGGVEQTILRFSVLRYRVGE